jgi:hypothetical protein
MTDRVRARTTVGGVRWHASYGNGLWLAFIGPRGAAIALLAQIGM